jgi:NADPH:quinone reductase-like Zn-dependent oxidoreductase
VQLHEFGGPEVLRYEDAPRPEASDDEVLVRVHAAGLNPPDLYLRDGYRALPPKWQPDGTFPLILGTNVSGIVAAVGDDVTRFSVGDEVYAMVRFPDNLMKGSSAYAEYACVPASELALKPAGIDHTQAAGAPMSLLTAWQFLVIRPETRTKCSGLEEDRDLRLGLGGRLQSIDDHRLGYGLADRHARVEARVGVPEYHLGRRMSTLITSGLTAFPRIVATQIRSRPVHVRPLP